MQRLTFVVTDGGCHLWTGAISARGYAVMSIRSKTRPVHVVVCEEVDGAKIPQGMNVDHLCRNRHCINRDHLEIVTNGENSRRGNRWPFGKRHRVRLGLEQKFSHLYPEK